MSHARSSVRRWWSGRVLLLAAAAVLVLGAGGIAWATIPDSQGAIHSCYSTSTGALRIIDPSAGQACHSGEAALAWNSRGMNWRGPWNATASYVRADVVTLGAALYVANRPNTDSKPPNASWAVMNAGVPQTYANVVSESNESNPETFPVVISSNLTTVSETTAMPPGNYAVTAQATIFLDNNAEDVQCLLEDNHGNFANGYAETSGPPDSSSTGTVQTLSLNDAFTSEASIRIMLKCAKADGADPNTTEAVAASLTAIKQTQLVFNGTTHTS